MTIKEIAETANVSESTVRNWIQACAETAGVRAKTAEAQVLKKPADFTLEQTIAIIRAGGNETLANLLMENATVTPVAKPKKLPSGAQMKVMLDAVKAKVMSPVQFQEAIGVTIPGRAPVQSRLELGADGGRVSPEDLEKGLMSLVPGRGASA